MIQIFWASSGYGIFLLRLVAGILMLVHGLPKLKNHASTAQFLGSVGFKPAGFWAWVVGLTEAVGGILLVLGLLVQPIAVIFIIQFIVILATVKRGKPLAGGSELDWVLLAVFIALATLGGGAWSIDRALGLIIY